MNELLFTIRREQDGREHRHLADPFAAPPARPAQPRANRANVLLPPFAPSTMG